MKLCPKCLGTLKPTTFMSGWLLPEEYECEHCGYAGPVALEESKDAKVQDNSPPSSGDAEMREPDSTQDSS